MRAYNKKRKPKHTTKLKIIQKRFNGISWLNIVSFNAKRICITVFYKEHECIEHYTIKYRYAQAVCGYDFKFKIITKYN